MIELFKNYSNTIAIRWIYSTLFLIITCLPANSQAISGQVFNNESRTQIPYANVFFNGTTIGTYTDEAGYFTLPIPKDGEFPLAVSAIGYESILISDYSTDQSFMIYMNPKIYELDEVIIRSKMSFGERMARKHYLTIFRKQFLGESLYASRCKILTENNIVFQYLNDEDVLKAYSRDPLIIINKALGYQIIYYIDKFECSSSGDLLNLYGNYAFKEDISLTGKEKAVAEKRRRLAFLGSRMHLFRSLWNNDLIYEGFTLKNSNNKILTYDSLIIQSNKVTKYMKRKGEINIAYLSKRSQTQINVIHDSVFLNSFGYFDPYKIEWKGNMANQRIGDLLPFDYIYEKLPVSQEK